LEPDRSENLQKWIDGHVGIPTPETPALLAAEMKLVKDLLLRIHTVDLDPLNESMLILDLSSE
jgi:hypothetical protein